MKKYISTLIIMASVTLVAYAATDLKKKVSCLNNCELGQTADIVGCEQRENAKMDPHPEKCPAEVDPDYEKCKEECE